MRYESGELYQSVKKIYIFCVDPMCSFYFAHTKKNLRIFIN